MIHEVDINPDWIKLATKKSKDMGALRESITKGAGNVAGFIGELAVYDLMGGIYRPTFNYDIVVSGKKYDIKTKRCTSTPLLNYECSIAGSNPNQKCDFYIFTRVLENYKTCWILGYISKEDFFKNARFCRRGDVDEKSHMNWRFKADCYNLEIKELADITELISKK